MAYTLHGIIGNEEALSSFIAEYEYARLVPLGQGLALIPVTARLHNEIPGEGVVDRFERLTPGIEKWAKRISVITPLAYVEAAFSGGQGTQFAIAWSGRARTLEPFYGRQAINEALRLLGVEVEGESDEFDTVGLGRYSTTDEWAADAAPEAEPE